MEEMRWRRAYDRMAENEYLCGSGRADERGRVRERTRYCRLITEEETSEGERFMSCSIFVYTLDVESRVVTDSLFIHDLTHSAASLERFLETVKREGLTCREVLKLARIMADAQLL